MTLSLHPNSLTPLRGGVRVDDAHQLGVDDAVKASGVLPSLVRSA